MKIWPFGKRDLAWNRLREAIDADDHIAARDALSDFGPVDRVVVRPDAPKQDGWIAMFHAAKFGSPEMVAILLSAGANPASVDPAGRNTIYWAACNIDDSRGASNIEMLLKQGVSPDWTAADGRTPIFGAILNSNPLSAKALLDGGASVHV